MADWNDLYHDPEMAITAPNDNLAGFFETLRKQHEIRNIIDLGCGTGRHAFYFAGRGYPVNAVDSSGNALEILKKNRKPGQDIRVTLMDLTDLSGITEKYDLGVCVNVLSHGRFHEIERMFREIGRVIRPGGHLFLILTPLEFLKYVTGPETVEVEKNSFLHIDAPDGDVVHHLFTEEEVRSLLKNYTDVSVSIVCEYSPWQKKEVEHMMVTARKTPS